MNTPNHNDRAETAAIPQALREANEHHQARRLPEAEALCQQILRGEPSNPDALHLLGLIAYQVGKNEIAAGLICKAIQISPSGPMYSNLGLVFQAQGKLDLAVASYSQALSLNPDYAEVYNNLGNAFYAQGKLDAAVESYHGALALKPDYAEAHNNLGVALLAQGIFDAAVESYLQALSLKPDYAEAYSNLGNALKDQGWLDEAVACYRKAFTLKPDYADAHSNLIFAMDMMATVGLPELQQERNRWNEAHAAPLWREPVHANDPAPARRLRVGYVSGDFREHSAAKTLIGLLTRYDRAQFDVYAYSNFKGREDQFTELFRQNATVWRNVGGLPDDALAQMIREDRIDILVDLSGHSEGNRLLVFARKPAPVQITGWGYGTSTGMRAMDVFFTDPVVVPPEDRRYFTEEVRYLASVAEPFFIEHYPDVNELPALSDGIITFGSFNRLAKVSDQAYRAWIEVLLAIPRSRLILKTTELDDAANRERVAGRFTQAGVAAERIIMLGKTSWNEHVRAYNQVDLALDPFPHGGGTMKLEGLMMGAPAITLRWPTIAGRISASIMTAVKLTDWIAETPEEYVELAVNKAGDLQSLAALRQQLRGRVTSVIGNQEAYARSVEQEYRLLWQRWCAGHTPDSRTEN